jgi:hypothetical protein
MNDQIEQRLNELRRELELGYRRLAELDKEREETRDTVLRIKGAIQVLAELSVSEPEAEEHDPPRVSAG